METTERKDNEIRLKRIAADWQEAFDSIPDFVSIHDVNYNVIRANRALLDALEGSPQDITGKPCYELLHKSHESRR
jgi:PAS domain-containing protein